MRSIYLLFIWDSVIKCILTVAILGKGGVLWYAIGPNSDGLQVLARPPLDKHFIRCGADASTEAPSLAQAEDITAGTDQEHLHSELSVGIRCSCEGGTHT